MVNQLLFVVGLLSDKIMLNLQRDELTVETAKAHLQIAGDK